MSEPIASITPDEADEIRFGDNSQKQMVSRQMISEHRWYTEYLIVFGDIGGHYGFFHMDPSTEMQEGQDEYTLNSEGKVPVYQVEGREQTVIVWKVKET